MKSYTITTENTILDKFPWLDEELINLVFDASRGVCDVIAERGSEQPEIETYNTTLSYQISTPTRLLGINVLSALRKNGYRVLSSENI